MFTRLPKLCATFISISYLAACGGGGDGGGSTAPNEPPPAPTNRAPVAVAGQDQSASVGQQVQLDASGSSDPDGDALTFVWTQDGGEVLVDLVGTGSATASFIVPDEAGASDLNFNLTVTDAAGLSSTDAVVVSIDAVSLQQQIATKQVAVFLSGDLFAYPGFPPTQWQTDLVNNYSISTLAGTSVNAGPFVIVDVADAASGQLMFLFGPANPILPDPNNSAETELGAAWVSPQEIESGTVMLEASHFLNALILTQPILVGIPGATREQVVGLAQVSPNYYRLRDTLEILMQTGGVPGSGSPPGMLDEARIEARKSHLEQEFAIVGAMPGQPIDDWYRAFLSIPAAGSPVVLPAIDPFDVYMLAHLLAEDIASIIGPPPGNSTARVLQEKATVSAGRKAVNLGAENGPRVIQFPSSPTDREFTLGNDTYVIYGYSIDGVNKGLIGARDSAFSTLGAGTWTQSFSTLGNGEHEFFFTRGVTSLATRLDRLAASANALKAACRLLDLVFVCPLSSSTIARGTTEDQFLVNLWTDIVGSTPQEVLAIVSEAFDSNGETLTESLIRIGADTRPNAKALDNFGRFVGIVSKGVGVFGFAAQTTPFIYDMFAAVPQDTICVDEENHVFSEGSENCDGDSAPTAIITRDPATQFDFEQFYTTGTEVVYSAFDSTDAQDEFEDLEFAWTGTLVRESDGSTSTFSIGFGDPDSGPDLTVLHSGSGEFQMVLEVRDTDGFIGEDFYQVRIKSAEVEQSEEFISWSINNQQVYSGPPDVAFAGFVFDGFVGDSLELRLKKDLNFEPEVGQFLNGIDIEVGAFQIAVPIVFDSVYTGQGFVGDNLAYVNISNSALDDFLQGQGFPPVGYTMWSATYNRKYGVVNNGSLTATVVDVAAGDDPETSLLVESSHQYLSGQFQFLATDADPESAQLAGTEIGDIEVTGGFYFRAGSCGTSVFSQPGEVTCTLPTN
jgi:hypothetical protein